MAASEATHNAIGSQSVSGLLGVALVVLKLTGVIKWSWLWVTLPFWAGLAFVILVLLVIALAVSLGKLIEVIVS